jgi:hypothetical protein
MPTLISTIRVLLQAGPGLRTLIGRVEVVARDCRVLAVLESFKVTPNLPTDILTLEIANLCSVSVIENTGREKQRDEQE